MNEQIPIAGVALLAFFTLTAAPACAADDIPRAAALLRSFKLPQAERSLQRILASAPRNAEARALRAEVLFERGKVPEALEEARKAVEDEPAAARPRIVLARILVDTDDLSRPGSPALVEAVKHAREAARLDPRSVEAKVVLSLSLRSQETPAALKESVEAALGAVDIGPGNPESNSALCYASSEAYGHGGIERTDAWRLAGIGYCRKAMALFRTSGPWTRTSTFFGLMCPCNCAILVQNTSDPEIRGEMRDSANRLLGRLASYPGYIPDRVGAEIKRCVKSAAQWNKEVPASKSPPR